MTKFLKKNYGWFIVAYGVISMMVIQYLSYNAFSLFVVPITTDLKITRGTLSLTTTIASLVGMVVAPIAGRLFSRKSVKRLILIGLTLTSLAIASQYFADSVYVLYALAVLRDIGVQFCMIMPLSILMNRWFKDNRSFAFSIIAVGISLGGVLFSVPLSDLIDTAGWRKAYLICGLIALAVLVPLCALVVKDYPPDYEEDNDQLKDEKSIRAENKRFSSGLHKDPSYWIMALGLLMNAFCCVGLYHISAFSESLGTGTKMAALMLSLHSVGAIVSKLIMGRLFDRFGLRGGILLGSGGASLAYGLMLFAALNGSRVLLIAGIACFGLSFGSQSLYSPAIISRAYDLTHYSLVAGEMSVFTLLGSALSNPIISWAFDLTQSYATAWAICLAAGFVALISLLLLSRRVRNGTVSV